MSKDIVIEELWAGLMLPPQDTSSISVCAAKPAAVKLWAESLPATRISYMSALLYKVLPEFSRLKIDPKKRLEMLEYLRPYVQFCIDGLSKDFLNQPLLLTEKAVKAATVAQALQKHMTTAYIVAAKDVADAKRLDKTLFLKAVHRATTGLGLMLMRSYQLYTPIRGQIWHKLHSLYLLGREQKILASACADELTRCPKPMTLEQVYMRALLLSCVRPNQLRQQEVSAVYFALEEWSQGSLLQPCGNNVDAENLYVVCLSRDEAPMYRTRYQGDFDHWVHELDNSQLLSKLKYLDDHRESLPLQVTTRLLKQLIEAWDLPSLRNFDRVSVRSELDICVGMSSVCFYQSGVSAAESDTNMFDAKPMSAAFDPWDDAADAGGCTMAENTSYSLNVATEQAVEAPAELPVYLVTSVDTSPGGYCVNWHSDIPAQARVGEVIGIKERKRNKWNVAVIRWVRQSGNGTQMGVQLLAPAAEAVEIAMINKMGDDNKYMRALLLPAVKMANQPATLLSASMPFEESSKVYMKRHGSQQKLQLVRKLFGTSAISQFTLRVLDNDVNSDIKSNPESLDTDETFDSDW